MARVQAQRMAVAHDRYGLANRHSLDSLTMQHRMAMSEDTSCTHATQETNA